jgi:hypothetical protein
MQVGGAPGASLQRVNNASRSLLDPHCLERPVQELTAALYYPYLVAIRSRGVRSMPIVNRVANLADEIALWRRDLHENPELGYDVHRTAGLVAD